MEVEICGRYGKSPVESDLGIIGVAKLAECFKFQNQDNRKIKFGQIARRWIRRSLKQMIVFSRT